MVTNNVKAMMKQLLCSTGTDYGLLEVKTVNDVNKYLSSYDGFPYTVSTTFTLSSTSAGISVGQSSSEEMSSSYQLVSPITSDLSGTVTLTKSATSENPSISFDVHLTNNGSSTIVINEIGYKQSVKVTDTRGGSQSSNEVLLLDRTVLERPVTLTSNATAVIHYTILSKWGGVVSIKNTVRKLLKTISFIPEEVE